jgi:lipid intermediate transporter
MRRPEKEATWVASRSNPLSSSTCSSVSVLLPQRPCSARSLSVLTFHGPQPVILCGLSTLAFHLSIRFLTSSPFSPLATLHILPQYSRPNSVSTALLVSSSTKLFPILMVIWEYDVPAAARSLGWAVVANNVEALKILLDCGYGVAALLATVGAVSRWAVGSTVLKLAGLDGADSIGDTSVAADGKALWALVLFARDWASRLAVG